MCWSSAHLSWSVLKMGYGNVRGSSVWGHCFGWGYWVKIRVGEAWGPIFEKSYDKLTKNLWKSRTYEKLRMSMWLSKNLTKILWKTLGRGYAKLWETYDDITSILRKHKTRGKWWHSENRLSEVVIGWILWAKNNWQPEWRFPNKNAFEKRLIIFLRKS